MLENCLPLSVSVPLAVSNTSVECFVLFCLVLCVPHDAISHTHVANILRKHCANNKLTNKYEKLPGKTFSVFVFRCQVAHGKVFTTNRWVRWVNWAGNTKLYTPHTLHVCRTFCHDTPFWPFEYAFSLCEEGQQTLRTLRPLDTTQRSCIS